MYLVLCGEFDVLDYVFVSKSLQSINLLHGFQFSLVPSPPLIIFVISVLLSNIVKTFSTEHVRFIKIFLTLHSAILTTYN